MFSSDLTKTNIANLINAYINKHGITKKEFSLRTKLPRSKTCAVLLGKERLTAEQDKRVREFLEANR